MKDLDRWGLFLGFIAVASFSFTLPMTHLAVTELDPIVVGVGRALVAAVIAGFILLIQKAPFPKRDQIIPLLIVGTCICILFPVLVSYAMLSLPASHGAIVIGLLPLGTTAWISLMNHEKPSALFWGASTLGALMVVGYALVRSQGALQFADLLLLATVIAGSFGYAHGAILARTMGGGRVMCWALVLMSPVLLVVTLPKITYLQISSISWPVWFAFIYAALISQLLGMMLWYKALSVGSVVRVSQVQLLQPFLTIVVAAIFFKEPIDALTWMAALVVVGLIQLSRLASVEIK